MTGNILKERAEGQALPTITEFVARYGGECHTGNGAMTKHIDPCSRGYWAANGRD